MVCCCIAFVPCKQVYVAQSTIQEFLDRYLKSRYLAWKPCMVECVAYTIAATRLQSCCSDVDVIRDLKQLRKLALVMMHVFTSNVSI